jgi:hypothetical protein
MTGGCYCGKVRYRADRPIKFSGNCHCRNCRRAAGAQSVAWISVEKRTFKWTTGRPKKYKTPTSAWRTFCPACGTSLTYENSRRKDDIDITTGSLDSPENFAPKRDFFAEEKLRWVPLVKRRRKKS